MNIKQYVKNKPICKLAKELDWKDFDKIDRAWTYRGIYRATKGRLSTKEYYFLVNLTYDLYDSYYEEAYKSEYEIGVELGYAIVCEHVTIAKLKSSDAYNILECVYGERQWCHLC